MYLFGAEGDIEFDFRVLLIPQDRREAAGNEECRYERSLHPEHRQRDDAKEVLFEDRFTMLSLPAFSLYLLREMLSSSLSTSKNAPGSKQLMFHQ